MPFFVPNSCFPYEAKRHNQNYNEKINQEPPHWTAMKKAKCSAAQLSLPHFWLGVTPMKREFSTTPQ